MPQATASYLVVSALADAPLRLTDEEQEEFRRASRELTKNALRIEAWLAFFLIPCFGVLDWVVLPDHFRTFMFLRLAGSAIALTTALACRSQSDFVTRNIEAISIAFHVFLTTVIATMCWFDGGLDSPYYAGMVVIYLGFGHFQLMPLAKAALVPVLSYIIYVAPALTGTIQISDPASAINNQFFLLSFGFITVVSCNQKLRLQMRQFLTNLSLDRARTEAEQANEQLKQLDKMKSQFFANITHELRTPLTMILAPVESVNDGARGVVPQHLAPTLKDVWRNGLKLLKLINDLLDFSKLEEGFARLRIEETNLAEFVRQITGYAADMAARKEITLSFEVVGDPGVMHLDQEKLERIVVNLVDNALKFTPIAGRVEVTLDCTETDAVVRVKDNGIGIAADALERVFERFTQADGSIHRQFGGTGIGLAFARELARLHGGDITVASEPGQGSTFTLLLRRGRDHYDPRLMDRRKKAAPAGTTNRGDDAGPAEWARHLTERQDYKFQGIDEATERRAVPRSDDEGKNSKILIVEDNPDILRLLNLELSVEHSVYVAKDGRQGIELALREEPDVILTDFMMPEVDGLTLIRTLREERRTADIPIIMLTAKGDVENRLAAAEAGADLYLSKPFSTREVRAAVNAQLKRRGRQVGNIIRAQVQSLELISASLAHEIHNPLAYIKNANTIVTENIEKLLRIITDETLSDADKAKRIDAIRNRLGRSTTIADQGVERISQIVDLVRRYARAGYSPEPVTFSIDDSLRDVLRLIHRPHDGVTLHPELGAGEALLRVRPEELHLVCRNLIQNAVEAIGEQGDVWISARRDAGDILIAIRDNGPGINRDHMARIFTPFFSTKETGKGMGIGLSIAFQIINNAGGSIEVASTLGEGATFTVRIPVMTEP